MSENGDELRIWIAVREDLDMPPGKLAAQVAHAACRLVYEEHESRGVVVDYMSDSEAKIVVKAKNETALRRVASEADAVGLRAELVKDAGRTVFTEPTLTVCGIGPCRQSELPTYIRRLQLL